jgi:predicted dehydrogenase
MVSRRIFLAGSALLSAPFISTRVTRALAAAARRKVGFALCGLGSLSTHQLAPALQKTENCRLAGIITGTPSKAAAWKAKYGIPDKNIYSYETMHRLADNPDIDVVHVVTPNSIHLQNAVAAAKAGKHVLCEKPMEISAARCQEMIDAVKASGRLLAVGYRMHFEPHHLECVRLARSGAFGEMKMVDAYFGFQCPPNVWRLNRALAGGGPLMDVGIYCLQASRYLTGEEPVSVKATLTQGSDKRFAEVEESIVWETKFPSGALAHCGTSYNAEPAGYVRALAQRGWFTLDPAFNYDGIRGMRSDGKPIEGADVDVFAAEMDDFASCILEGRPTKVPGEEGLRDLKILMGIYEAARTGNHVDLQRGSA